MITNKKHNRIVKHKEQTINDYYSKIIKLEKELDDAKNLKEILDKLSGVSFGGVDFASCGGSWLTAGINLPDNVLQYTEDILGGRVIKQEGIKCLVIDKNGNVKTGLTKQKEDKGYNYKLVRD